MDPDVNIEDTSGGFVPSEQAKLFKDTTMGSVKM